MNSVETNFCVREKNTSYVCFSFLLCITRSGQYIPTKYCNKDLSVKSIIRLHKVSLLFSDNQIKKGYDWSFSLFMLKFLHFFFLVCKGGLSSSQEEFYLRLVTIGHILLQFGHNLFTIL